jgi:type VI secretion system secreted protein VgrG
MNMANYTQADRPLSVKTQLADDALLLIGLTGHEAISQLFSFQLDLLAEESDKVKFEKLLGQPIIVRLNLENDKKRYFSGICKRASQGGRSQDDIFTSYQMEIVPQFWLLTKRAQSRIFQHLAVPDILKKVLTGVDVTFELHGTFQPRDYCVQYRESDFNFASRLMEEEGIYYFFKHTSSGHQMVVANTPDSHTKFDEASQKTIIYEEVFGGNREENRIISWEKTQELRSGKVTLWDHCFELPHKHLEAEEKTLEQVEVGTVSHHLKVGQNDRLEIYEYPGAYAQRFDGVDKSGGERPADLSHIFEDNKRTTKIRMEQETLPSVVIQGGSDCGHLVSGYQFTLDRHFDGDGDYVLTGVTHSARVTSTDYRSGSEGDFEYENRFTAIPLALPFAPPQVTIKPTVRGTQTAVVVGPKGEEIFTDKYGRVKVQFHWDREGKQDADSSCWIRVGQNLAGKKWGAIYIPRIGQEVIVDFLEGDADQPIIVGSVYNASEMPPYKLPDEKTKTVIFKSNTSKGGGGFNEIRVEDKKDKEQIFIHAQRNKDIRIRANRYETVGGEYHLTVYKDQKEWTKADKHLHVKGDHMEKIEGSLYQKVGQDEHKQVGQNYVLFAGKEIHLDSGLNLVIEADVNLTLKVGGNFININPAGIFISGTMVMINSGGSAGVGTNVSSVIPGDPTEADTAKPGQVSAPQPASPPPPVTDYSVAALQMKQAAKSGAPGCEL